MEQSDGVICVAVALISIAIAIVNYYGRKAAEEAYEEAEADYQEARRGWGVAEFQLRRERAKVALLVRCIDARRRTAPNRRHSVVTQREPIVRRDRHHVAGPWDSAGLN